MTARSELVRLHREAIEARDSAIMACDLTAAKAHDVQVQQLESRIRRFDKKNKPKSS